MMERANARNNRYVLSAWLIRIAQMLERGANTETVAKKLRAKANAIRPKRIGASVNSRAVQ